MLAKGDFLLRLYNSLTNKKEEFKPIEKGMVSMYNCGPTVYFYAHIGNLRSFMFADTLRRYLEYKKFDVRQVMNITDVGHMTADDSLESEESQDKMEAAMKREKKDPWQIASFYTRAFIEDSKKMNFKEPFKRPRATEEIDDMIKLIESLVDKGYAYVVKGCVYYDVSKFEDYGKLSGNTVEKLKEGAGGRVGENKDKKNHFDFALWIEDPNHLMGWRSPWGEHGYPGWHIECSVMSTKYLGESIDIHTGGEDNKFPHHECEIAQSEGATGKKFCNYWLHVRHLLVDGEKMSKSTGNFYTLRDLLDMGYEPKALRLFYLKSHYRSQMNFTLDGLKQSQENLKKLHDFVDRIKECEGNNSNVSEIIEELKKNFEKEMDDDLNTPGAISVIFDFVHDINKMMEGNLISSANSNEILNALEEIDGVLGLLKTETKELPDWAKELIEKREKFREEKEWEKADQIRYELKKKGIIVEDTPKGPRYRYS